MTNGGMKQVSEVLLSSHWVSGTGGRGHRLYHWCPGCRQLHGVEVDASNSPCWTWDGSAERPTFGPSLLHFTSDPDTGERETLCHYFVRDGMIEFCGDSPHEFAGKKVPLPPIPAEWRRPD